MNKISRLEMKYFISSFETRNISSFLNTVMLHDPHDNSERGYKISSLYFDTTYDDDLNQKLDGILYREKYRIRIYNDDASHGKFEVKRKLDTCIEKLSVNINKLDIKNIISGDYSILTKNTTIAYVAERMNYLGYTPKAIVTYFRKAFFLPFNNIRITIDSNLGTHGFGTNLLDVASLINTPIQKNGYDILEIKYENYLPCFIKQYLRNFTTIRSSISKYSLSRIENNTEIYGDDPLIPF